MNGGDKEQMLSTSAMPVKGDGFVNLPMAEFTVSPTIERQCRLNINSCLKQDTIAKISVFRFMTRKQYTHTHTHTHSFTILTLDLAKHCTKLRTSKTIRLKKKSVTR